MTDPLILREGAPPREVDLAADVAEALAATGAVDLDRTAVACRWAVAAGSRVGALRVGDLQIIIQPKIPVQRLVFLMTYARRPGPRRQERVNLDPARDLPEALAHAFIALAGRALDQGLLKGYRTVDERLPLVRGRIREADQIRQHFGRSLPLEVRYDEFTVDIAENRLLLASALHLLRAPGLSRRHRAGLQRLRILLADVAPPTAGAPRPRWAATRLNARYVPALELADLILDGRSFEQRVGNITVTGYLINFATVFEDFVTVALAEAMRPYGGRSRLQYRTHLDEDDAVPIRPDYVWLQQDVPTVVADAKYKAEKPAGFPQADLYQLLAYCTVLRLPVGHLIYAKGNEPAREHVIRNAGVSVIAHALDLDTEPAELLRAVANLAETMRRRARVPARESLALPADRG